MDGTARLIRLVQFNQAKADLPANTLFHAGPPYRATPPEAVLTAAAQAAVIGEMAADLDSARAKISSGAIALRPAQEFGLVAPLAQVVAPSMWCLEVGDDEYQAYSPVSEGPAPALRFGSDDAGCITRARDWCAALAAELNPMLAKIAIEPEKMMQEALKAGDDCHARTLAGTNQFVDALPDLDPDLRADILTNVGFSLGIWMAWCAWKLRTSGSRIVAIGGNGIEFGVKYQGDADWKTTPAPAPTGVLFAPEAAPLALGAIGDSAVVDACGFGGQALRHAPSLVEEWEAHLPGDALSRHGVVIDPATGIIDPERITGNNLSPIINLAILNRNGAGMPIGRGFYCPPVTIFATEN